MHDPEQELGQRATEEMSSRAATTITEDSRTPVEKSSRTREYRRSAAWALIRGSSAVMTEIPTIAYGIWNSCHA